MNRFSKLLLSLAGLIVLIPNLHGQAVYTADRSTRIQAGAGYMFLKPDYVEKTIQGATVWADYDFKRFLGIEAEVHLSAITPQDIAETSYLVGPRFVYHRRKLTGYGKFMIGRATITNQNYNLSSSYNVYALGGGAEYHISPKINLRVVDFEMQQWPTFSPNNLSPIAISFGASYIIR